MKNAEYENLRDLYSEKDTSYDSLNKGLKIEKLVNGLMREVVDPLKQRTRAIIGKHEFDGEVYIGRGKTIIYEIFAGKLSNFRYQSLLNLVRTTYFPRKTYLLIIARTFSNKDKQAIGKLTKRIATEKVKIRFMDQEALISLHKFSLKIQVDHAYKDLRTLKGLFLERVFEPTPIINEKLFDDALSAAVERSNFVFREPTEAYVPLRELTTLEAKIQDLENMLEQILKEIHILKHELLKRKSLISELKETFYEVDLTTLQGEGSFQCPKCGILIDPGDESEEVYKIIESRRSEGQLAELILLCRNCGNRIRLVGFIPSYQRSPGKPSKKSINAYLKTMR